MCRHASRIAVAVVLGILCLAVFGRSILPTGQSEAAAQQPARSGDTKNMPGMQGMPGMNMQAGNMAAKEVTKAVCVLHPLGDSKVMGKVTFTKMADGVHIEAELTGLTPGEHGFHIHEWGDCSSADGTSTGGHFNPTGAPHAGPTVMPRHEGDFGNVMADASGKATLHLMDKMVEFSGPNSVIGRGMIVHAGKDDLTTQPSGNAGGRVACGVIGIANPAPPAAAGSK